MKINHAYFRFYASLNDFLSPQRRQETFIYQFRDHPAVKDAIEALGVPHPEVELIVANGKSVGFYYSLQDGDCLSVYPHFQSLQLGSLAILRPPLAVHRFVLDVHLGKLAI